MCFSRDELIPLSEAQAKLNAQGLKRGTKEYLEAAQKFVETGMFDENREPLFFEDESGQPLNTLAKAATA